MFNKEICINANIKFNLVTFNLVISSSIFMSKTLYDSPTLMEIIFS
ncbi:MAG: hypothetical protein ACREV6_02620 [Clostridium sp.]